MHMVLMDTGSLLAMEIAHDQPHQVAAENV